MVSRSVVKCLQVFALLGYTVCTLVFSILAYKQVSENVDDSVDIFNNWKTGAIQELVVANTRPNGFEDLFNYTWPGIDSGCDCRKVGAASRTFFKIKEQFSHSSCSSTQMLAGCTSIPSASSLNLDTWGTVNSKKVQVYAQRSNETWADVALKSGEECTDPNLKKCGSSANNTFCTALTKCPITSVSIKEGFAEECLAQSDCWVLSTAYGKTKILTALRGDEEDALPLADMRINEYAMCNTKEEDNITPGRPEFEWQNGKRSTCTTQSKQWTTVDQITEQDLFEFNNLTSILLKYIPLGYYPAGKNGQSYQWGAFSRQYIPWYSQCRSQMPELLAKHKEIKSLKTAQLVLLIVTSIIGFLLGLVVPILICTDKTDNNTATINALNWIGKILLIPFQIFALVNSGAIAKFLSGSTLTGCSDDYTVSVFSNMGTGAANAYSNDLRGIFTTIAAIVFDIFLLILSRSQGEEPYYPQVNVEIQARNQK